MNYTIIFIVETIAIMLLFTAVIVQNRQLKYLSTCINEIVDYINKSLPLYVEQIISGTGGTFDDTLINKNYKENKGE